MENYDYLIIGGGMTGAAAARAIREVDGAGSIGLIGVENHPPYDRPPLTKKLWQGKPEESIWNSLPVSGLELLLGRRITQIDAAGRRAVDADGRAYHYGKLLLATGGAPNRLPFLPPETNYYRTVDDYHKLRAWTGHRARIGVIGGGFIGSEIAASLASNGERPVMVFPESGIGSRIYPADLSDYITRYFVEKGVEVHTGVAIQAVERRGGGFALLGNDGQGIEVDHILAGIGIRPETGLAEAAGIQIAAREAGGGILVDAHLQTSQPGIYAAGDAASFYNPALDKTMRVEHADNARSMGRAAGLNMAGRAEPYDHLPFFYSDLFDLGYEAVGELDPRHETQADWQEPYRKGVIYYRSGGKTRGVLLWNVWDQVDAARELIAQGTPLAI